MMNIRQSTTRWLGLGLACCIIVLAASAEAKKPIKPPPEPPPAAAYDVVWLGDPGTASTTVDINEGGLVVGKVYPPDGSDHLMMVVPEVDNGTLVWCKDADLDGRNDLLRDLGIPPEMAPDLVWSALPRKINDHGLILVTGRRWSQATGRGMNSAWILPPRVENGRLTWADLDSAGLNRQIAPLPVVAAAEPHVGVNPTSINNHGEVALTIDGRGYLLVPDRYEVSPDGAVTAEYPAVDLDGDGLNDHLVDLGSGISFMDGQVPPLLPSVINDQGEVAGVVEGPGYHELPFVIRPREDDNGALIWNEDEDADGVNDLAVYLPLPDGDNDCDVLDMNENGMIVGWVDGSREGQRAGIWQVDWEAGFATVTRLGTAIRNYDVSAARAVNATGQVVGRSTKFPSNPFKSQRSNEKGWLFDQGEMVPVADLVSPETGLAEVETRPFGINDSGLIIGHQRPVDSGWWTSFILIPAAGQ